MSLVSQLHPLNLSGEKQRFFANPTTDPQFEYASDIDQNLLQKWGLPQPKYVAYALKLLDRKADLRIPRVPYQNAVVAQACQTVIDEIGIAEKIEIMFETSKATRCSVSGLRIIFKDSPDFASDAELQNTINHEIQTHLLRNLNQKKQGWKLNRALYDDKIMRTEEGLAELHSFLNDPAELLWRPAAYYVAVDLGMRLGFKDMFTELISLGFDQEFAWRLALRVKRGLTDTSRPGGNTKDLCYLEGAVQMWQWLSQPENNPQDLYLGKIFIEELAEKKSQIITHEVYLPLFMKDLEKYRQLIVEIGQKNTFAEVV